ncbi:MAG TPA: TonB-dependent receptor [Mucilaginibacter sp.]|jgi:TonB-linked SusC/RagA family outer membrane protein
MRKKFTYAIYLTLIVSVIISNLCQSAHAQGTAANVVKGIVTDSKGVTLPGVSIKIVGTTEGTVTDVNGAYKINAAKSSKLQFSFVGFVTQTVTVGDNAQLNISLANDDSKQLNEVVVVGYGTQKQSDITGSVSSVPKARLSGLPSTNVLQSLEGSVAGLSISNNSSVPGAVPVALVRGQNSITASSGPYIVVDGIPLSQSGGTLNDINPDDIASMQVLKDASAAAIYGTNGSAGVILITTKRGTVSKPVIRYTGYAGVENIAHILEPRNGQEYTQKYADYLKETGQTQTSPVPNYTELPNYNAGKTIDWIKATTQQGVITDNNLSITGGSTDVKYFVSGEYQKEKGVIDGYQYNRASVRANLDFNVTNFLTVGTTMFYAGNNYDGGRANLLFGTAMSPYGNEYNADGTYAIYPMFPEQLYTNPLLGLTTQNISRGSNINGSGYAEVKFGGVLKGLKYRLNAGYNYIPAYVDTYSGRLANVPLGAASATSYETTNYTVDNLLYYDRDFGKSHINFTGLYSAQNRDYFTNNASATGFINDELGFNNLGAGATQSATSFANSYSLLSQMVRLNYSYDERYLFTFTVRRDGSSVFGANTDKYGWFPVAAVGWNLDKEAFMKNVSFIDNLKLRASYGRTGNQAIQPYQTVTTENTVRFPFNGISTIGVQAGNLGNANLHWETTTGTNVGVDFSLLKNRIGGTIDAYSTHTDGLLLSRSLPTISGYTSVLDNIGKTANKGIEVTLNTHNIESKDFHWETSIVYSVNRNKITELYGDGKDDLGNRWFLGYPIGVIYDYKMVGVWQTGQDPSKQDPGAKPGDLKFADTNGDGKITAADKVIQGQTTPKWTGGITNTFHYKNFNFSFFIQTAQGMLKNDADLNYADESGRRNTPIDIGYWTPTNGNNSFQALSYTNTRGYGYPRDASYTRIKDATLSYSIPAGALEKIHVANLTVYLSGRNLYTFTKWIGWDPEDNYLTRGVTTNATPNAAAASYVDNYPLVRSFILGANISLK